MMDVLVVEPGKRPKVVTMEHTLAAMQDVVGGLIQVTYPFEDAVGLVCNEEGKLEGLPFNCALRDRGGNIYDVVAGTFFICGLGEEDLCSLPEDLQKKFAERYKEAEAFIEVGGKLVVVPCEPEEEE